MNKLTRQLAACFLAGVACSLSIGEAFALSSPAAGKILPNIILIQIDDLDFNEIGAYDGTGKVWTPHMDALVKGGMKFTQARVGSPICVPSRYSTLTGKYVGHARNLRNYPTSRTLSYDLFTNEILVGPHIGEGERTIAHFLKEQGYVTGIVGKSHNDEESANRGRNTWPHTPLAREIVGSSLIADMAEADAWSDQVQQQIREMYHATVERIRRDNGFDVVDRIYYENKERTPIPTVMKVENTPWITEGAIEFLRENREQPFFLYYSNPIPHTQVIHEADKGTGSWGPVNQTKSNMTARDPRGTPAGWLEHIPTVQPPREEAMRRARKHAPDFFPANAVITWLDDSIGAIMTELRRLGLEENTVVIFMSDHQSAGKFTPYDNGARIPFAVYWKGSIQPGTVTDSLVSNVDVLPTILELAGGQVPVDAQLDGVSFVPVLKDPTAVIREHTLIEVGFARALVTKKWKYIAVRFPPGVERPAPGNLVSITGASRRTERMEIEQWRPDFAETLVDDHLYDLESDPDERNNLFGEPGFEKISATMKERLREELQQFPHAFGEFKR